MVKPRNLMKYIFAGLGLVEGTGNVIIAILIEPARTVRRSCFKYARSSFLHMPFSISGELVFPGQEYLKPSASFYNRCKICLTNEPRHEKRKLAAHQTAQTIISLCILAAHLEPSLFSTVTHEQTLIKLRGCAG